MELINIIESKVTTYFPELVNRELIVNEIVFKERSTYPLHKFDIRIASSPESVVASLIVKFAPVFEENNEGKTEFENMCLVKEKVGHEKNIGRVNPLEYIDQIDALVTEYVPHERLSGVILNACVMFDLNDKYIKLKNNIFWSGTWLSSFHSCELTNSVLLGETDYFDRCESIIKYLKNIKALGNCLDNVSDVLSKERDNISRLSVPMSRVHGDYGPQNIGIGDDDKVYVFDLQRKYNEAIYYDITYFLVTLETINPYPKHIFFNRAKSVALSKEFLAGYKKGLDGSVAWDMAAYHAFYLRNLLQRVQKQYINQNLDKSNSSVSRAKKVFLQNTFTSKINRELKFLSNI